MYEDRFVSPVVITVRKDKLLKIALGSRKLKDSCMKFGGHLPNLEELLNQISTEMLKVQNEPLWKPKIHLEYAYDHLKLSEETSRQCKFAIPGGNMNGVYRFRKWFYGLCDIPTVFQEKIDQKVNHQTPVCLDDIIIGTRRNKEKHRKGLFPILEKSQNAGYRVSGKKSELFDKKKQPSWGTE